MKRLFGTLILLTVVHLSLAQAPPAGTPGPGSAASLPALPGLPALGQPSAAAPVPSLPMAPSAAAPGAAPPPMSALPALSLDAKDTKAASPGGMSSLGEALAPAPKKGTKKAVRKVTATESLDNATAPAEKKVVEETRIREEKEPRPMVSEAPVPEPVSPRLTPRGAAIEVYPRPAVVAAPEAGIVGPYGPGLASAAPVGTPYLRSPAFAGPPVIYMPQTVTRVLVPGVTPYPSNPMRPPVNYIYASAPFMRTDIYVDLPYGTYYWPQGYAGTAPVEPQVPAYVMAPSVAVTSNEASYAAQRYVPGAAHPETVNPTGSGVETLSVAPASAEPLPAPPTSAPPSESLAPAVSAEAPLPAIGAAPSAAGSGTTAKSGIIVDDSTPGAVIFEPKEDAWQAALDAGDSYNGQSRVASADGKKKTATFLADVPETGRYELYLWYVANDKGFRSPSVTVIVNTANGPAKASIDQTKGGKQFTLVGTYDLKQGKAVPVATISTEGIPADPKVYVSADAMKLVKVK